MYSEIMRSINYNVKIQQKKYFNRLYNIVCFSWICNFTSKLYARKYKHGCKHFFAVKLIYFIEIGLLIFRIQIGKSWKQIHGKIANIVIFLTAGWGITFIEEYMWNPYWISIRKRCLVIDYMFVLALMMTLLLIIKKTWIAYWLTLLLSFIYGLINFFCIEI